MFLKAAAGQAKSPFRIKPSCALRFKLARQKIAFWYCCCATFTIQVKFRVFC